jgi:rhamnogalacturonyl hydrolase YesR
MKAFCAALIAAAILYVVDLRYNDGRYTQVLQQAVTSLLPG